MSSLQITLILLGLGIVLAVVVYNHWYNARHAPRKARHVPPDADPASADSRQEPTIDGEVSACAEPQERPEPSLADPGAPAAPLPPASGAGLFGMGRKSIPPVAATAAPAQPPAAVAPASPTVDAASALPPDPLNGVAAQASDAPIQAQSQASAPAASQTPGTSPFGSGQEFDSLVFSVVPLELDKPVSGDAAIAAQPPTRRIGKKQFLIQGFNTQTRLWELPRPGAKYSQFQAAIQLANRQGPLNEIEFSEFVIKTQEFADAIGAAPDFPDMLHEVARGREVDSFAAQNDAVLNLMLMARRATWSPGYVRQCAAQYGFKPSVTPGRLVLPAANPSAPPVLVIGYDPQAALADDLDHAPVHELLVSLDVPNVDRAENAFPRMRAILEELADTMEGHITDPDGRKLPTMAMDSIAADVERLYDALDARGLPAGSPGALKLFS